MPILTLVLNQLEQERNRLASQLENLNHALAALNGKDMRVGRTISVAGRARIAAAQRARWAKLKRKKVVLISGRKGRTMSTAARKRIAMAQRARWAKWRRVRKAA